MISKDKQEKTRCWLINSICQPGSIRYKDVDGLNKAFPILPAGDKKYKIKRGEIIEMIIAVKINKSLDYAIRAKSNKRKKLNSAIARKSIKDMTVKYWPYQTMKNKVDDIDIVVGVVNGVIYSAFKIEDYMLCERLGKGKKYTERVEFICNESEDKLIGIDLEEVSIGGWTIKFYDLEDLIGLKNKQGNSVEIRREEIMDYYTRIDMPYNPKDTYDYPCYYYGDDGTRYRKSKAVKKQTHERSKHICEECRNHKSEVVHHIELLSRGGEDCTSNTMSLCNGCHKSMHKNKNYNREIKPRLLEYRKSHL
jgi:hypothetical protein